MKADVTSAVLSAPAGVLERLELLSRDLKAAGRIGSLTFAPADEISVTEVVLAPAAE
jgi:hypothetical protein